MPLIPFSEYRPDVSDFNGASNHTATVLNVIPRGDGYGPFQSLTALSTAMAGPCRGLFFARKNDGTVAVFAGTTTKLYLLSNTDLSFTDVTQGGSTGAYSALGSLGQWQFEQFNKNVVAVQQNVAPQVYSLTTSTAFADLAGSPPQAAHISVVNRFLVLSGIIAPDVYRLQWSDLNDITNWSSGQADAQDFADGGIVRGVAGGEFGVIMQDASIRRMTYAPGSPYVFGIDRIAKDDGIYAPYSLISSGDRVFYLSNDGFKMLLPGAYPQGIGKEKVDRSFFADVDTGNLHLVLGVHDPARTRVYWCYKSVNGVSGQFDKVLCYDFALDKWSLIQIAGEYMTSLARPGITLEGVDAAYGPNIDTIVLSSLDDISTASVATLGAISANHEMGFFTGDNLEAQLETGEQGGDGKRIYVNGIRPITDAPTVYGSISKRATPQSTTSHSTETIINTETGICPARVSTRYMRGKIRIPEGTTWTFAAGIEPEVRIEGER